MSTCPRKAEATAPVEETAGTDARARPGSLAGMLGRRGRRWLRMSGYRPGSPLLYRAWNLLLVIPLLVFTAPLIALIAVALAATQGPRHVFYRGARIGRAGRPFFIFKFKTLRDEAALLTKDRVLPSGSKLETPLGAPLRDTRLDELPQLFNVLLGDMNMLGPRPVRQAIAEQCRAVVPNYDIRFDVKPGLIGYTQALMPHGADKAIRARVNAMLCRRQVHLLHEVAFVILTGLAVLRWTGRVVLRGVAAVLGRAAALRPYNGEVRIDNPDMAEIRLRLLAITDDCIRVEASKPLPMGVGPHRLVLRRGYRFRDRARTARCIATVLSSEPADGAGCRYVLRYSTTSPLQKYLIDRHFVGSVLVH